MSEGYSHAVFKKYYAENEVGKVGDIITRELVIRAAGLVKKGQIYDLGCERYRAMPVHPFHPPFEVIGYRTPDGVRNEGDQAWLEENNDANLRVMNEVIFGTTHTGTHIDSLAHITCGIDNHWYGNHKADRNLGDRGPLKADGSKFVPLFTRGVMLDVATFLEVELLHKSFPIGAQLLEDTAKYQNVEIHSGDTVLIRTGYMSKWPDPVAKDYHGAGILLEAAKWLAGKGVVNVGGDTESLEEIPSSDPHNPHPVHSYLLIDEGIHIMEMVHQEQLSKDKVYEFLFVGLPLTIRGTTGSMMNPVAII